MRKKIFKILSPVVFAVIMGYVFGKFVYGIYDDNLNNNFKSSKIYLLENGNYETYEEMREANNLNNYIYYIDDEIYKTVVGITQNKENINKIKKIYNDNLLVDEYYIPAGNINSKQDEYDQKLTEIDSDVEIKSIVDQILNLYKDEDSIRLVSLN